MLCATGLFTVGVAHADRGNYRSPHPIPDERPGAFCYIDASHTHTYTPASDSVSSLDNISVSSLYIEHQSEAGTQLEFVGDPMTKGYEGPLIGYGEAHPIQFKPGQFKPGERAVNLTCEIEGAHFHLHEPRDPSQFENHKGTYYFGSYKAAMSAKRERAKLLAAQIRVIKAEERAELREEQRLQREEERAVKAEERATAKAQAAEARAIKAQERAEAKEARRLQREEERANRLSQAPTTRSAGTTEKRTTEKRTTPKRTTPKRTKRVKKKSSTKQHRSWMDRRRGR